MQPYDRNIPYNNLPALPPSVEYYKDEELFTLLTSASRKLAELKGIAAMLPNQSIFINTIALREAKASSAIENIFTTDDELYKALAYQDDETVQGPAKEILHYREALWEGFKTIKEEGGITVESLIKIYRHVKQSYDGIRPYQAEIVIKKRGWGSLIGETVYTPPRGKGVVEKMLSDMVDFMNDDLRYPIDPLLKMAMVHYQFEAIHPFRDGNGRTGRILCILYLIDKGLLEMQKEPKFKCLIAVRNLKTVLPGKFYRFVEILIVVFVKDNPAEVETFSFLFLLLSGRNSFTNESHCPQTFSYCLDGSRCKAESIEVFRFRVHTFTNDKKGLLHRFESGAPPQGMFLSWIVSCAHIIPTLLKGRPL